MNLSALVSAAVVNYQTPDLLEAAVESFCRMYPRVPLLIIDNGSRDGSPALIHGLHAARPGQITTLLLEENRYHGPAMHVAMQQLHTPYVYIFDSDTETERGGFLEAMTALLADEETRYGAGQIVHVNKRGFAARSGVPVLASAHMLLKRDLYHQLPPFVHHGLPALANFAAAAARGYRLCAFPIQAYVRHLGRGTADRYGYGLGVRSKLDFLLNKLGL
jgi:glycosyltransferase involved in cell wall biosynthesis